MVSGELGREVSQDQRTASRPFFAKTNGVPIAFFGRLSECSACGDIAENAVLRAASLFFAVRPARSMTFGATAFRPSRAAAALFFSPGTVAGRSEFKDAGHFLPAARPEGS